MLYLVTFEAEVGVQVEAEDEDSAEKLAQETFMWQDVTLVDVMDITLVSEDEEELSEDETQ